MSEICSNSRGQPVGDQVRSLYTELAQRPDQNFGWGKGKDNARVLGYDPAWLQRVPAAVWESAAAVGNPFSLGPIRAGETVIDLGSGAGADVCVAALLVGETGRVIGVDFTAAMAEKARANAILAGLHNVTIHEADIAELPLPDARADVVISNGSINLSPRKACAVKEAFRVSSSPVVDSTSPPWCATCPRRKARRTRHPVRGPTASLARSRPPVLSRCSKRPASWT